MLSGLTLSSSGQTGAPVYGWQLYTGQKTMKQILAQAAQDAGLTVEEVCAPGRTPHVSNTRQRFMYEAARDGRWSWCQIARACGRTNHATAMYGAHAYAKRHGLPAPEARV